MKIKGLAQIQMQRSDHLRRLVMRKKAPENVEWFQGYGANLYYPKPTSFNELVAGLTALLRMNWNDPLTITSDHFRGNKFVAYNSASFN